MLPYILGRTMLFALAAISPDIIRGLTGGQSIVVNLAWLASFDEQLHAAELYPRWLGGLWQGD